MSPNPKVLLAAAAVFSWLAAPQAHAADCDIPADIILSDGYLVGGELLAMPDEGLASYIIGYINAVSIRSYSAPKSSASSGRTSASPISAPTRLGLRFAVT